MNKTITVMFLLCLQMTSKAQIEDFALQGGVEFSIHKEVTNAEGEVEQELIQLWQKYLLEGKFEDPNSPYWSFEHIRVPDENLWAIGIPSLKDRPYK